MNNYSSFIFTHIPKCGGTSFRKYICDLAIQSGVTPDQIHIPGQLGLGNNKNLVQLGDSELQDIRGRQIRVLADHTMFRANEGLDVMLPEPFYYTLLRDPVSRFISHYNFFCFKNVNHHLHGRALQDLAEDEFKLVLDKFSNLQVKYLANESKRKVNRQILEVAFANLTRYFGAFGILEELEVSLDKLARVGPEWFDFSMQFPKLNSYSPSNNEKLDSNILERICSANYFDICLYERAIALIYMDSNLSKNSFAKLGLGDTR